MNNNNLRKNKLISDNRENFEYKYKIQPCSNKNSSTTTHLNKYHPINESNKRDFVTGVSNFRKVGSTIIS